MFAVTIIVSPCLVTLRQGRAFKAKPDSAQLLVPRNLEGRESEIGRRRAAFRST